MQHLRPGKWAIERVSSKRAGIASFAQYAHIAALVRVAKADKELAAILGNAYTITDRKSTRLNSSHRNTSRMPSSA